MTPQSLLYTTKRSILYHPYFSPLPIFHTEWEVVIGSSKLLSVISEMTFWASKMMMMMTMEPEPSWLKVPFLFQKLHVKRS